MKLDYKRRDEIIFDAVLVPESYDIHHFDNLGSSKLQKLLDEKLADPKMTQNESPTIKKFNEFLKNHPIFRAIGYVVTPLREDARVSIEGVKLRGKPNENDREAFIKLFRKADEFTNEPNYLRAWFD